MQRNYPFTLRLWQDVRKYFLQIIQNKYAFKITNPHNARASINKFAKLKTRYVTAVVAAINYAGIVWHRIYAQAIYDLHMQARCDK